MTDETLADADSYSILIDSDGHTWADVWFRIQSLSLFWGWSLMGFWDWNFVEILKQ